MPPLFFGGAQFPLACVEVDYVLSRRILGAHLHDVVIYLSLTSSGKFQRSILYKFQFLRMRQGNRRRLPFLLYISTHIHTQSLQYRRNWITSKRVSCPVHAIMFRCFRHLRTKSTAGQLCHGFRSGRCSICI